MDGELEDGGHKWQECSPPPENYPGNHSLYAIAESQSHTASPTQPAFLLNRDGLVYAFAAFPFCEVAGVAVHAAVNGITFDRITTSLGNQLLDRIHC